MSFKSSLLRFIDSVFGPAVCGLLSRDQRIVEHRHPDEVDGPILIIRPGGIGDAILLLPMLHALRREMPNRRVDILCESRNQAVFTLAFPDIQTIAYDRTPIAALRLLRTAGYGTVIDTEQFHNFSGAMTALSYAPLRIGFKINTNRRGLYTHLVSYDLDGAEDEQFGRLLSAAFGRILSLPPRAGILSTVHLAELPEARISPERSFLLLHAGGSIRPKQCPDDVLATVCQMARDKYNLAIVITGSQADAEQAARIALLIGESTTNLCGHLSLAETATLCSRAKLLLGPDSGIAHLAVAVGTPVVVVFGPSDPAKWGPPPGKGAAIRISLPCSPCSIFGYTKPCQHHECMTSIRADDIAQAVRDTLEKGIR